jgi:hypothetical protein
LSHETYAAQPIAPTANMCPSAFAVAIRLCLAGTAAGWAGYSLIQNDISIPNSFLNSLIIILWILEVNEILSAL